MVEILFISLADLDYYKENFSVYVKFSTMLGVIAIYSIHFFFPKDVYIPTCTFKTHGIMNQSIYKISSVEKFFSIILVAIILIVLLFFLLWL